MEKIEWGTACAAYQVEGAWNVDEKEPSIWDEFCEKPGTIKDASNAKDATKFYYNYKEDIRIVAEAGFQVFRMSISWPRVLHQETNTPNPKGIAFYNKVFDELERYGIKPSVTLYHWDLPASLHTEEFPSWLTPKIVPKYMDFVNLCFREWGHRVDYWVTFNEPHIFTDFGYNHGIFAPGVKNSDLKAAKNILIAHGSAVRAFRQLKTAKPGAKIGITLDMVMFIPLHNISLLEQVLAEREMEKTVAIWSDPIFRGHYPESLVKSTEADPSGQQLEHFSAEELSLVQEKN